MSLSGLKAWYHSKGVNGGLLAIAAASLPLFGFDLDEGAITETVAQISGIVGGVMAVYGRVTASKQIG